MSTLTEFLERRFQEVRPLADTAAKRAKFLQIDAASYSKILGGKMGLSAPRAALWATKLCPSGAEQQDQFRDHLLALAENRIRSVAEFCDSISDGAVPVTRISELFKALLNKSEVKDALICAEYRDLPRAGEAGKYEALGDDLADAVANGLTFAMFQPFTDMPPEFADTEKLSAAETYMEAMRVACRDAYRKFRVEAEKIAIAAKKAELKEEGAPVEELNDQQKKEIRNAIDKRLRLYERNTKTLGRPAIGGFQAKIFLVHHKSTSIGGANDYRIIQWIATKKQDLLIYRSDANIDRDALKDTLYPVPHYFELFGGALPSLLNTEEMDQAKAQIHSASTRRKMPHEHCAWKAFKEPW